MERRFFFQLFFVFGCLLLLMVHILEKKNQSRDIVSSYLQPEQVEEIEKSSIVENIISDSSHQLLVFNRVPKCGSTTTLQIIDSLKRELHFNVLNDIAPHMSHQMSSDEQEFELVQNITKFKEPMLYIRHTFFIDFPRYGVKDPLFVNIVRDPVTHFISGYYYRRYGFEGTRPNKFKKWRIEMPDEVRAMTLDECVRTNYKECSTRSSELISFFCGHSSICKKRDDKALAIAKQKVLERYAIVGILEDINNTMKAFEVVAPNFFAGASRLLNDEEEAKKRKSSKTAHKDVPSNATLEYLQNHLKREYELYDFIKKTFYEKINQFKENGQWIF